MRKHLFFLVLIVVGCKTNVSHPNKVIWSDASSGDGMVLTATTLNCGLAPGVVHLATPRILAVAEEIRKIPEVGVMCFEELWTEESRDAVIRALGPNVYTYYVDTQGENQHDGVNVCSESDIKETLVCARNECSGLPDEEQTICVTDRCKAELLELFKSGLSQCLHCLVASVGKPVNGVVESCVQPVGGRVITGTSRPYKGQNDVLLASRWPLKNTEVMRLRTSFSNRVALFANIEPEGYQSVEVACAHISTKADLPPNYPGFDDWDEEMIAQIDDISVRLKERAGNGPLIFLGDMNAGPAIGGWIKSDSSKVWNHIMKLGFYSPAVEANPAFCSICESNTLGPKSSTNGNYLIDHVLMLNSSVGSGLKPISARPIFNQKRRFVSYYGEIVEMHLSDHYGVAVDFYLERK